MNLEKFEEQFDLETLFIIDELYESQQFQKLDNYIEEVTAAQAMFVGGRLTGPIYGIYRHFTSPVHYKRKLEKLQLKLNKYKQDNVNNIDPNKIRLLEGKIKVINSKLQQSIAKYKEERRQAG